VGPPGAGASVFVALASPRFWPVPSVLARGALRSVSGPAPPRRLSTARGSLRCSGTGYLLQIIPIVQSGGRGVDGGLGWSLLGRGLCARPRRVPLPPRSSSGAPVFGAPVRPAAPPPVRVYCPWVFSVLRGGLSTHSSMSPFGRGLGGCRRALLGRSFVDIRGLLVPRYDPQFLHALRTKQCYHIRLSGDQLSLRAALIHLGSAYFKHRGDLHCFEPHGQTISAPPSLFKTARFLNIIRLVRTFTGMNGDRYKESMDALRCQVW
jgi:hypothetical protein